MVLEIVIFMFLEFSILVIVGYGSFVDFESEGLYDVLIRKIVWVKFLNVLIESIREDRERDVMKK